MADGKLTGLIAVGMLCVSGYCCAEDRDRDAKEQKSVAEREFTLQVLPVLKSKCFGCHGDDDMEIKGELDARSRAGLLAGGESGEPSIVPGKPAESLLVQAIHWDGVEMPPKENDRLNDRLNDLQIERVRRWIEHGAPWPNEQAQRRYRVLARSVRKTAEGEIDDLIA